MNRLVILTLIILLASCQAENNTKETVGKTNESINNIPQSKLGYRNKVMIFGTFHFNQATDASDVVGEKVLDVRSESNQDILEKITSKIALEYQPSIIAIEFMPEYQSKIDSLYQEYLNDNWKLGLNEAFQIGFRVAKKMGLKKVHCVDNRPPQPESVTSLDDWEAYAEQMGHMELWSEYDAPNNDYNSYMDDLKGSLTVEEYLKVLHSKENQKRSKELWLTGLVNLGHGDNYAGADLTGHWYCRNTRIFTNIRNRCASKEENVLVIYGNAHKWVLDELFDGSPEFDLVQPMY